MFLLLVEPFSWTAFFLSLAFSAASFAINRIFGPKPPKIEKGRLSGDLYIQNSEEGLVITDVFGAAPGQASSGITWTNLTLSVVQSDNSLKKTSGADNCFENASGSGDGGARSVESIASGDWEVSWNFGSNPEGRGFGGLTTNGSFTNDFAQMRYCIHVSDQNNTSGTPHPAHSIFVYENGSLKAFLDGVYAYGDTLRIRSVGGTITYWHKETLVYTSALAAAFPMYFAASLACLNKTVDDVVLKRGAQDSQGGIKMAGSVVWAESPRKVVTKEKRGGKGIMPKQTVENITYYTDLAIMGGWGSWRLKALWANADKIVDFTGAIGAPTGVMDGSTASPGSYSVDLPPPASANSTKPHTFWGNTLTPNAQGTQSGQIAAGGGAKLRIYEGNYEQLPDALIQADVDGKQGANSTPAFRGRFYIVFENFNISKYGSVPTFLMLVEHKELTTLGLILDHLCDRVGIEPADRDFSSFDAFQIRGIVINQRQAPRLTMELLGLVDNVEFYESADGVLTGLELGGASVVTVDPNHLGTVEGDNSFTDNQVPQLLDSKLLDEVQLPRALNLSAFDPAKDYEKSSQVAYRMTGFAVGEETIDLPMTLPVTEVRQTAERAMYRRHVEAETESMTLPMVYGYLEPAKVLTVTNDGITHRLRVQGISGALPGALEFEMVSDQAEVFAQTVAGASGGGYTPPTVQVPVETIAILMDTVTLRDEDNAAGYYAALTPISGNGSWNGAALYRDRGAGYEIVETFLVAATMGKAVGALPDADPAVWDYVSSVDVDLYNGETLESVTEDQVLGGANAGMLGDEVIQFASAVLVGGFPNRWRLSTLLRARRGTDYAMATHQAGERFVLLDGAVQFVSNDLSERSIARNFKAVTSGFALADTASTSFTWDAGTLKPLSPVEVASSRDGSNNLTITWQRRTRVGSAAWEQGNDAPIGEQDLKFEVDVMNGATVVRTITATAETCSYSAADQTTDFGSAQASVTVKIYQISATVGRGRVRQATI